jgi:hemerythrin-like domain-containing protein
LLASAGAGSVLLAGHSGRAEGEQKHDEDDVSPIEDLMREHGILRRLLLVYGEVIRRVEARQPLQAEPIAQAAQIIRSFIEDYHERDEEDFIFPRFKKAGKLAALVDVLLDQHQAGRKLTADIQRLSAPASLSTSGNQQQLAETMRRFIRMYEPHAAREDTVLFPAFASLVGEKEMKKLQEIFEQKEKALPGGDFEKMLADVTRIEQTLGIYDLGQFTPKA